MERHPATQQIMRWFSADHLPDDLAAVSGNCIELAHTILSLIPADGPELTAGLRKLLEAKDCFVRAAIAGEE